MIKTVSSPLALLLALALIPAPALAQPPTPGQVQESLRPIPMIMEREAPPPEIVKPESPRQQLPPNGRRVPIKRFEISGNTLFSDEELLAVVADWRGKELSLAEIYHLSDLLTDFYQARGYSLTTVTVPAQRMREGILRLAVVEGRVGKIILNGNRRYREQNLTRQLVRIRPGTIVRFKDLEREVLLLNDLPGMLARSVLKPGEEYGTTDIQLNIEETTYEGRVTVDNSGLKVVGRHKAGVDFTINNPGRFGDLLTFGYTHSEAGLMRQGRFGYGLPLLPGGTRLDFSYNRAEYDVGGEFSSLGVAGVSETIRLQAARPLIRSRRTNLALTLGAARVRGRSDLAGIPLSDNAVTFFEAGLNYDHRRRNGSFGSLSALFATNLRSNSAGDRDDALPPRLELKGSFEQPLDPAWSVLVRGEAVLNADPMPDSHKYGIGGPANVRAFVSSSRRGDYGLLAALELRRRFSFNLFDLQARTFIESARVGSHSLPGGSPPSASLTGAGVGGSFIFAERYLLDLNWAAPLDDNDSGEGKDYRLWLTFSAGF